MKRCLELFHSLKIFNYFSLFTGLSPRGCCISPSSQDYPHTPEDAASPPPHRTIPHTPEDAASPPPHRTILSSPQRMLHLPLLTGLSLSSPQRMLHLPLLTGLSRHPPRGCCISPSSQDYPPYPQRMLHLPLLTGLSSHPLRGCCISPSSQDYPPIPPEDAASPPPHLQATLITLFLFAKCLPWEKSGRYSRSSRAWLTIHCTGDNIPPQNARSPNSSLVN